jgi:glycosyltransferase involved in cell wall biosynthesis
MNVEGIHYGQKAHSFRELLGLPARTRERLEVALSIHAAEVDDIDALRMNGWSLIDPVRAAGTPDRYQRFIACSKAELGIAKSGYVHSHCGWFGDRSACYLASGRPVVAQDTGWARLVTPGLGLLAFDDCGEAAEALDKVGRDYSRHCRAARTIATEFFDSTVVLDDLLEAVGRTTGMVSEL